VVDHSEAEQDGSVVLHLRTGEAVLEEAGVGGLKVFEGTNALETIYSLMRLSGVPDSKLDLPWSPGLPRAFLVCVAADGVEVDGSVDVAGVAFMGSNPFADQVGEVDFGSSFQSASAWALVPVQASTIVEAEQAGLKAIRTGFACLRAANAVTLPSIAGRSKVFRRLSSLARITPPESVLVSEVGSQGGWFRGLKDRPAKTPAIDAQAAIAELGPSIGAVLSEDLLESLKAWNRAVDADDDLDRVAFLSRSMEAYANRATMTPLFDKAERQAVRKSLGRNSTTDRGWTGEQQKRLADLTNGLNNAPLKIRFLSAIEAASISTTPAQVETLWESRALRNRLEHGGALTDLEDGTLRSALNVMNQILIETIAIDLGSSD